MKYKVGDKVIIRSWEDMEKQFGLDRDGDIKTEACFLKQMRKHCGKKLTISNIRASGNFDMKESEYIFSEDEFEKNHIRKIVITSDGTETLARLYEGGKVVKSATAKCSPKDEFNFDTGARLAFDRLIESTAEKKEEYYNGKVVCTSNENEPYMTVGGFTVGKVYTITDGFITNDTGWTNESMTRMKTIEEVCAWLGNKFIPLVE
jgi:hypothetical protein